MQGFKDEGDMKEKVVYFGGFGGVFWGFWWCVLGVLRREGREDWRGREERKRRREEARGRERTMEGREKVALLLLWGEKGRSAREVERV